MLAYCYYPLCWVLFISTKTKPYLNMELKRYYPLCWVLFISTSKALGQTCTRVSLLPTMLGSFHFYKPHVRVLQPFSLCYYPLCWVLFISTALSYAGRCDCERLLPTMLGSFHFYGTPSEAQ